LSFELDATINSAINRVQSIGSDSIDVTVVKGNKKECFFILFMKKKQLLSDPDYFLLEKTGI